MCLDKETVKHFVLKEDANNNIIFYRIDIIFQVPFYIPTPISLMVLFLYVFPQTNGSPMTVKSTSKGLCQLSNIVMFYCNDLVNIELEKYIYGLHFIITMIRM